MLNKTQTPQLESFTVYRDGELDKQYERTKQIQAAVGHFAHVGSKVSAFMANAVKEAVTPVILDIADTRNGTNLREQYFANKRQAEATAVAETFGLRVE